MYWPDGVAKIYSINGPGIKRINVDDQAGADGHLNGAGPPSFRVRTDDSHDAPTAASKEEANVGSPAQQRTSVATSNGSATSTRSKHSAVADEAWAEETIIALSIGRHGHIFVTLSATTIAVWNSRPTAVLAAVRRSARSIADYGLNVDVHLSPDSSIIVVQTSHGYLLTYSIAADAALRTYQQRMRRNASRRHHLDQQLSLGGEVNGLPDISVRSRVVIKIEAGSISKSLALEREMLITTTGPVAAVQLIRYVPDEKGRQTQTVPLSALKWMLPGETLVDVVYDRAMNIFLWTTDQGNVYAVQRTKANDMDIEPALLFRGHRFHTASQDVGAALRVAVNARFSLFAVCSADGELRIYTARDYVGNMPLTQTLPLPAPRATTGSPNVLSYSPDGYCLFAGYEQGWAMWSVFGKPGAASFHADRFQAQANGEGWLLGVCSLCWAPGGTSMLLVPPHESQIYVVDFARSALAGCYVQANLARALLQTSSELVFYRGHDVSDLTTISGKESLWHHARYPMAYLNAQWPIRACVASQDGRYVAIAGRRGLAHYSVNSGRWKTFSDPEAENAFAVHGGMCWYGHMLIVAVACENSYELRIYSRELSLTASSCLSSERLPAPVVFIGPSGEDSLLVYTQDNVLNHFVINTASKRINLVQVGQIAFHGIIRAPTRVRSVSWVLPDAQLRHGDPAQDVSVASVLILIDGKLVLLQPATSETGELKYEMRSVANEVEYYILMRDQMAFNFAPPSDDDSPPASPSSDTPLHSDTSLRDSLWVFCGNDLLVWTDVQDVLRPARSMSEDIPKPLPVPVDFYPLSTLLNKGVVLGAEPELIQRRDLQFTIHRHAVRTQLFLPYVLQHHLANADTPAALSICHHFCNLSYFPHALEILLHHVLDEEVERRDRPRNRKHEDSHSHDARGGSLLPLVLSFLQAATPTEQYLDTIVQCTRKTELQFWETLFAHLPPPSELFEQAMELGLWKTAGGYLLVLQALEASEAGGVSGEDVKVELYVSRLLSRAICAKEWELCTELTNFLMALDPTGTVLKRAVAFPLPSASSGKLSPKSSPGTTAVPSNEPHIDTVHQLDDSKSKQLHAMVNGFDLLTLDRAASHGPT